MSETDIQKQFNQIAQVYDRQRPKFIPCFYDFYKLAIDNLELNNEQAQVLDLGAGTGLFSSFVHQKYPSANILLVDISKEMLDVAKERFKGSENVNFECTDIKNFKTSIKYDAIISSLAIHHLEDSEKIEVYNKIYDDLKQGGLFIHAEQVEGETPYMKELNHSSWVKSVESTDLSRAEIDAGYERVIKLDKRAPLTKQLQWLRESGFSEVDCLYKYYDFTVIYCKK